MRLRENGSNGQASQDGRQQCFHATRLPHSLVPSCVPDAAPPTNSACCINSVIVIISATFLNFFYLVCCFIILSYLKLTCLSCPVIGVIYREVRSFYTVFDLPSSSLMASMSSSFSFDNSFLISSRMSCFNLS